MQNIYLLLFASAICLFPSCKRCGTCTTTTTTTVSPYLAGYPKTDKSTVNNVCGADFDKADGATATSTTTSGTYHITAKATTKCVAE